MIKVVGVFYMQLVLVVGTMIVLVVVILVMRNFNLLLHLMVTMRHKAMCHCQQVSKKQHRSKKVFAKFHYLKVMEFETNVRFPSIYTSSSLMSHFAEQVAPVAHSQPSPHLQCSPHLCVPVLQASLQACSVSSTTASEVVLSDEQAAKTRNRARTDKDITFFML